MADGAFFFFFFQTTSAEVGTRQKRAERGYSQNYALSKFTRDCLDSGTSTIP